MLLSKFYFDLGKIQLPGLCKRLTLKCFFPLFIIWVIRKPFVLVSFVFAPSDLASPGWEWQGGRASLSVTVVLVASIWKSRWLISFSSFISTQVLRMLPPAF